TMTLERAMAPLMTIGGFCNLAIFEYPLGQPRTYISCLYGLAKWSLLIYFCYYPDYIDRLQKRKTIYFIDMVVLLTVILILISICRFKELKMCLRELAIVDQTLESLGTPNEYQILRDWIIRIIIGWIVYSFSGLIYYIIVVWSSDKVTTYRILNVIYMCYPMIVIILSTLTSATILGLVLYICVHLICKSFLLTLCVQMFTERNT
ncbi:hypothetical protein ALC57_03956, partial [Trachymyrmex cornetzi]